MSQVETPAKADAAAPQVALKRSMKMLGVLLITLSSVTPASSIFVVAPTVMQQAGAGAVHSFALAAVIGLFIAFVYAELSSAFPHTGGEYAIVGRILGPFWGFVIMGLTLMSYILMSAVIAQGAAAYLTPLFPSVTPAQAAVAIVAVSTVLGVLNIKTNAMITGAFLVVELLALVAVVGLGFANISRPLSELLLSPVRYHGGALEPVSLGAIGLATSVTIFAYSGYGGAVYLSEETHDARRHVAKAILWALAITVAAEATPVVALLLGAPDIKALLTSTTPLSDFITGLGGSWLNTLISLGVALAIVNAIIAFMIMDARLIYSTARDGMWRRGVNLALLRINPRFESPHVATIACGVVTLGACLIDQHLLTVITGASFLVIYGAMCAAVIVGRRNGTTSGGLYQMPWYPFAPLAALAAMGYVVYASVIDPELGWPSVAATLFMMAVSGGYYLLVLKRDAGWAMRDAQE